MSWRVAVLLYVGYKALYDEFKLDDPWDSPHNRKLVARMPQVFRMPGSQAPAGMTTCLAPWGRETVLRDKPQSLEDLPDGTCNTILLVDASDDRAVE